MTDPFADKKTIFQQLLDHQQAHYRAELDSGQCLSGPHKDDFETLLGERSVKAYGSQARPARRLSVSSWPSAINSAPTPAMSQVLLLDDVLSAAGRTAAGFCAQSDPFRAGAHHLL